MDLINKLSPTDKQTKVKVFFINVLPFKFDRWAPKNPPVKEPSVIRINRFKGTKPILLRIIAPTAFQKIPTVKKVMLIALRKSIPKVFINSKVTNNPVPEDIEPFKIPIKKISIANLNFKNRLKFLFIDIKPNSGLRNEYNPNKIEKIPKVR